MLKYGTVESYARMLDTINVRGHVDVDREDVAEELASYAKLQRGLELHYFKSYTNYRVRPILFEVVS